MKNGLGEVRFPALRVRLWPGKFREPDLVFMAATHKERIFKKFWGVPDLAVELISDDDPDREKEQMVAEYRKDTDAIKLVQLWNNERAAAVGIGEKLEPAVSDD